MQALLSPMVSGLAVGRFLGQAGDWFSINLSLLYLINIRGRMLSLDRDIERHWLGSVGVQHHSMNLI